jgi:hypothetical protein
MKMANFLVFLALEWWPIAHRLVFDFGFCAKDLAEDELMDS